ncbi:MAG: VTT domain-containing protein [Lysobacteraceae bacterium]
MLVLLLSALAICLAWLYFPIESAPSIAELIALAQQARTSPLAPLVALGCFVIGGVVVFPVNLLIAATIIVFEPLYGALLALLGSLLSAIVVHEVGRRIPQALVERLFGARGERLRARVVGHGLLAIAIVRIVPVAPYSVVSLVSGVARIRRRDYIAGTALGMLPGIVLYALFLDRARAVLLDPHPLAWLGLAGVLVLIVAIALAARFWSRKQERARR